MKIKLITILALAGLAAAAIVFTACNPTADTGNNKGNGNTNVNKTTPTPASTATPASTSKWNSNISKEDYEKDKAGYEKEKTTTEKIGTGVNDSWLWFKTRSSLAMANDLRDSTIGVSVDNEVVTLSGTVANAAQKTSAETAAKAVTGVKSVKNDIKVAANDSLANHVVNGNTKPAATEAPKANTAAPAPKK